MMKIFLIFRCQYLCIVKIILIDQVTPLSFKLQGLTVILGRSTSFLLTLLNRTVLY